MLVYTFRRNIKEILAVGSVSWKKQPNCTFRGLMEDGAQDVLKFLLHCDKNNQNVVFVKNEGTAVILAALKANCQAGSTDRERKDGQQRGE